MRFAKMKRGDIWIAKGFYFAHESDKQNKERPVIILQNDEDNARQSYPLIFIVPITTQKVDKIYKQGIFIPGGSCGLNTDSKVLFGMLRAIPKKDLICKIGEITKNIQEEINIELLRMFGFLER